MPLTSWTFDIKYFLAAANGDPHPQGDDEPHECDAREGNDVQRGQRQASTAIVVIEVADLESAACPPGTVDSNQYASTNSTACAIPTPAVSMAALRTDR